MHRQRQTHSAAAEVGYLADSGFRRLPESEVSALATECLLGGAGNLEESALDQGLTHPLAILNDRGAADSRAGLRKEEENCNLTGWKSNADYRCIPLICVVIEPEERAWRR